MKRSQADRRIIAARAALAQSGGASPSTRHGRNVGPASTDLASRTGTPVYATGPIRRSRAMKLTAAQKNDLGRASEWNRSTEFFTDARWSK